MRELPAIAAEATAAPRCAEVRRQKCKAFRSVVIALDCSEFAEDGSDLDAKHRQDLGAGERGRELEPDRLGSAGCNGGHPLLRPAT